MEIIEKISDKITAKLDIAEEDAKCALYFKEERPALAEGFYRFANEEMAHVGILHTQIVSIIDEYRKEKGEPPEAMKTLYDILHRKHIEHAAAVKGMLALYKEQ